MFHAAPPHPHASEVNIHLGRRPKWLILFCQRPTGLITLAGREKITHEAARLAQHSHALLICMSVQRLWALRSALGSAVAPSQNCWCTETRVKRQQKRKRRRKKRSMWVINVCFDWAFSWETQDEGVVYKIRNLLPLLRVPDGAKIFDFKVTS